MNAACALGLCVAGLRGQLRKLLFGVSACYAGLAPPVVHLGWVACSGDVLPDLKSSEFEDPLYGVINGHICKRRDEHLAACHLPQAQRFLMEVLGAERGLHLGASATTLCNVRLFSSRSAE
jgi:hypothetical protein